MVPIPSAFSNNLSLQFTQEFFEYFMWLILQISPCLNIASETYLHLHHLGALKTLMLVMISIATPINLTKKQKPFMLDPQRF